MLRGGRVKLLHFRIHLADRFSDQTLLKKTRIYFARMKYKEVLVRHLVDMTFFFFFAKTKVFCSLPL